MILGYLRFKTTSDEIREKGALERRRRRESGVGSRESGG